MQYLEEQSITDLGYNWKNNSVVSEHLMPSISDSKPKASSKTEFTTPSNKLFQSDDHQDSKNSEIKAETPVSNIKTLSRAVIDAPVDFDGSQLSKLIFHSTDLQVSVESIMCL